jgi:hypothetical protein
MIETTPRVPEAGNNVIELQIGELFDNLLGRQAGGKEIEDIDHSDAEAPNAGASATLLRIDRDTFCHLGHCRTLPQKQDQGSAVPNPVLRLGWARWIDAPLRSAASAFGSSKEWDETGVPYCQIPHRSSSSDIFAFRSAR